MSPINSNGPRKIIEIMKPKLVAIFFYQNEKVCLVTMKHSFIMGHKVHQS